MEREISVSAPGKLMLLGEHAVVYNHPCLVTAVDQRMHVQVEVLPEDFFELEAEDVKITGYKKPMKALGQGEVPKGASFVETAVKNFSENHKVAGGLRITTRSEFSSQFGFGSSSASTVCVIKALSELSGAALESKEVFDLAYKTVLDIQGKGSGFDVAAAIYGGTVYFFTGGKLIEPLSIDEVPLVVGYSGIKADTVTLINQVSKKAKKYPELIENVYTQIEKIVERAKTSLSAADWPGLGELMNLNQGFLETLGVSIGKLSAMIYAARDAGAFGAKLSGAGGGDCMIALVPLEKRRLVAEAIGKAGAEVIDVKTNAQGVRVET